MSVPEQNPEEERLPETTKAERPSFAEAIERRLHRNVGLKVLSLLIAIGLWSFVNAGQRSAIESMQVPVSYRSLPNGLMIVNHPIDFVKIQVMGPRTLLSLLDPERLTVKLDLSSIGPGQASFKITPAMFDVPRQTAVTSVAPSDVILDVDKVVRRDIPVHLAIQGKPAKGYMVNAVEVNPPTVRVIGPSRFIDPLEEVTGDPIDVDGATATVGRTVLLRTPGGEGVVLSTVKVDAKIDVVQKVANREFRNVALEVRDSGYKYRIDPKAGSVTLRGPELKLAQLKPEGLLYVEAKDLAPGRHSLDVRVKLPDGMQLVRQQPEKAKLRLYSEKISRKADEHRSQVVRH